MLIKLAITWYVMLWLSRTWVSLNFLFHSLLIWITLEFKYWVAKYHVDLWKIIHISPLSVCCLSYINLCPWNLLITCLLGSLCGLFLQHGYAVIDLQILCPLKIADICLMKFLSLVLQVLLILHMIILFLNLIFYIYNTCNCC